MGTPAIDDAFLAPVLAAYTLRGARVLGRLEASNRNDNLLVVDTTDARYVLRRFRRNPDARRVEFQLRFQQHLRRHGLPTAEVVETRAGTLWVLANDGFPWVLFTYVEGHEYDFGRIGQVAEAARRLAQFHAAAETFPGVHVVVEYDPPLREWWVRCDENLRALAELCAGSAVKEELTNDHEIVMRCRVACLDLPFYYSSAANVMMFSKQQWDAEGEMGYERKAAGTGPYEFKERQLGWYVLYQRAPTPHWKYGVVDWKEIQMTWTLEESTRFAQLLAGETHLTEVNKDLTDELVAKGYKLIRSRGTAQQVQINFGGLYFGTEDPQRKRYTEAGGTTGKLDLSVPWTNKKVRQAMNKAINREELLKVLYKGRATPMNVHGFFPDLPGWDPTWEQRFPEMYGYELAAAKRLLAEAGYPKGFKAKAWLFPFAGAPELIPLVEAVQIQLREVGIELELEEADWVAVVRPKLRDRKAHGYLYAIPPSKKAVEPQIAGFNAGKAIVHQFEADELYQMWEDLRHITDPVARDAQPRKIGNYKFENFEIIPLFDVFIEVIADPKIMEDWAFPG